MHNIEKYNLWGEVTPFEDKSVDFTPMITAYPGASRGAVIVFAGGAYVMRADHESYGYAKWLSENGITAFVVDYRVAPYKHPAPLADAMRAIRYVRHNADKYGIDKNKIAVMGSSAGGHLVGSLSVHYDKAVYEKTDEIDLECARPDATIFCYPVIDMREIGHAYSRTQLLGENPSDDSVDLLCLQNHVNENTPEAFIWHTSTDTVVNVQNSYLYATALARVGVPCEVHVYPIGNHGLGLAPDNPHVASWGNLLLNWLTLKELK